MSPPFWTPRTLIGFVAFLTGVVFAAWMLHDRTLTWQALSACFVVSGAGLYFVDPPALTGYVHEVREVAPVVAEIAARRVVPTVERSGRRDTDPAVVTSEAVPEADDSAAQHLAGTLVRATQRAAPPPYVDEQPTQRIDARDETATHPLDDDEGVL